MQTITSRENPQVKRFIKLSESRAERESAGLFAAEGLRLCMDGLKSGFRPAQAFVTERALEKWPQLQDLLDASDEAFAVSGAVADKLADSKSPQGVFAAFELPAGAQPPESGKRFFLLNNLQDPGNVGTIIRAAEALGLDGIGLCNCPDVYSPKVLRASMGGAFRLKTWAIPDMPPALAGLRAGGFSLLAAALTDTAKSLAETSFTLPCAVLFGNEGAGLPQDLIKLCDLAVKVPLAAHSTADSLCVATAAGIFAWEMTK
jgi:TrmH family RNA methyltransferase